MKRSRVLRLLHVSALAAAATSLVLGIALKTTRTAGAQSGAADHTVTRDQYEHWKTELSNWGRWGKDDQLGALNLITPAKRKQAAALVKEGFSVSLAGDANTEKAVDNPSPYEQNYYGINPAPANGGVGNIVDELSVRFHGQAHTHLDALNHRTFGGKMYNGTTFDPETKGTLAAKNSIHNLKNGIFTRGILVDVPRLKGVPFLEANTRIYAEDLEAWEKRAKVTISAGDALFIRTGRWARRAKIGPFSPGENAGLDLSVGPWLKKRDIAILGGENPHDAPPREGMPTLALHDFVLISLGVNLLDDTNLEALSEACAARNRWEFLLTAAPLPVKGGTGSPINPIATF